MAFTLAAAVALLFDTVVVSERLQLFTGPHGAYIAVVMPVGKRGFEGQESRIEIRRGRAVVKRRSFASEDGEHGFGVTKAAWTPNGQFFIFSMQSSGGHQPWHWPQYVYSVRTNRLYYLDDYIGSVTSKFVLLSGNRLRTTRMNFETKEDREPVVFRLGVLLRPGGRGPTTARTPAHSTIYREGRTGVHAKRKLGDLRRPGGRHCPVD